MNFTTKILITVAIVFAGAMAISFSAQAGNCQCSTEGAEAYAVPEPDSVQDCCQHCNKDEGESVRWNGTATECSERETGESSSSSTGSNEVNSNDSAWRAQQLSRAESSERGLFTEGLSAECIAFGECSRCDVLVVAGNVFRFAFQIVGILAVLVIFIGGMTYARSGGNEETAGRAKKIITAAVVGLIIVFSAWLVINTIVNMTGLNVDGNWWSPNCS